MVRICLAFTALGLRVFGFFTEPWLNDHEIHRLVGEPARVERHVPLRDLNIVSWNIEQGVAYDRIASTLRFLDADVILLQEVDRACRRSAYRDVARELAYALDMNWVAAGEFQEIGEGRRAQPAITGQAILSRFAIDQPAVLRFTAQDRFRWAFNPVQPRRGGRIAISARTGGYVVYNTHIESSADELLKQRQIAEILTHQATIGGDGAPILIAGDLNNKSVEDSRVLASIAAARFDDALGNVAGRAPTSLGSQYPIDWIFVRNGRDLSGRIVDAPGASDHSPVFAAVGRLASQLRSR
jgi:endonuclease/exonuclease/phosphatase family metal-dependent hydrolase